MTVIPQDTGVKPCADSKSPLRRLFSGGLHFKTLVDHIRRLNRILARETCVTILRLCVVAAFGFASRAVETVERDEFEAGHAEVVAHFVLGHVGRQEFVAFGRVDTVKAGPFCGRRRDAVVHLGCACIQQHVLELHRGCATHNAVVNEDDPFASDQGAVDVQFETHTHVADLLGRLDERPSDVLVPRNAHGILDAAFLTIADRRWRAAIWNWADDIGLDGCLAGKLDANLAAGFIDRAATKDAVWAAEIDVLEDAET